MKKLIFLVPMLFTTVFAMEPVQPNLINTSCFEKVGTVNLLANVTKVVSTEKVDTFIQNAKIVPWKLYKEAWELFDYTINLEWDKNFLQDNNPKTYLVLDTAKQTELNIVLKNTLKEDTYRMHFDWKSDYYVPELYISEDWNKYYKVKHLWNFDLKYLKIKFVPKNPNEIVRDKIKIYDLYFYSKFYTYIVNANWQVKAYANNLCKEYFKLTNTNWNFAISKTTPVVRLFLSKNPNLNTNLQKDSDGDGILDNEDNCPYIPNPLQKDKNADWKGDKCSDVDKDGIVWYKDNCPYTYNPNQKDVNNNGVWDACEFDKDKDGIFDSVDNCITTPNPDQKDDDKDGIWNACDNCKYYNPQQEDKNNNWIGDVCEEKEKYLKEHDKDKDGIIDYKDNCEFVANPDQKDSDKDGVWDACDNCLNIDNPKQLDKNQNWVWDMCEDVDKDWFVWYEDNCPYIANPKQEDSDNDGIWNVCEDDDHDKIVNAKDNCPYDYNPDQKDIDKDWIWDVCDKKDDRFLESNKYVFITLLLVLVVAFGLWIWAMIKKMKE